MDVEESENPYTEETSFCEDLINDLIDKCFVLFAFVFLAVVITTLIHADPERALPTGQHVHDSGIQETSKAFYPKKKFTEESAAKPWPPGDLERTSSDASKFDLPSTKVPEDAEIVEDDEIREFKCTISPFRVSRNMETCFGPFILPCPPEGCAVVGYRVEPSNKIHHMLFEGVRSSFNTNDLNSEVKEFGRSKCNAFTFDYAFGWAYDESDENLYELDLPNEYEYRVASGSNDVKFFVINAHFSGDPKGLDDSTSVVVKWKPLRRQKHPVHSFILIGAPINIPPRQAEYKIYATFRHLLFWEPDFGKQPAVEPFFSYPQYFYKT